MDIPIRGIIVKKVSTEVNRGQIKKISLRKPIIFNGNAIKKAVIEIDHINYGLNPKTKILNNRKRTNFTVNDIERFLILLDGEYIAARDYRGRVSRFEIRIDCPIAGRFKNKPFILIFDIDYNRAEEIYTVTLFPGW